MENQSPFTIASDGIDPAKVPQRTDLYRRQDTRRWYWHLWL